MKELIIEAKIENLDTVLDFVSTELEAVKCSMKMQRQIAISVEEIFVNIAHYAYEPCCAGEQDAKHSTGGAIIRVAVGDEITIEFMDRGKPYNPLEKDDPDITIAAEERQIGGLGVLMVKNMMDTVEYEHKDGKNILTIKKTYKEEI